MQKARTVSSQEAYERCADALAGTPAHTWPTDHPGAGVPHRRERFQDRERAVYREGAPPGRFGGSASLNARYDILAPLLVTVRLSAVVGRPTCKLQSGQ